MEKNLLAVTANSLNGHLENTKDFQKAVQYFKDPNLQFITFSITEKGYNLKDSTGQFFPSVMKDIEAGPTNSKHTISVITALLYNRFKTGQLPIAMVSTDNFSQNGCYFKNSILTIAKSW